MVRGVVIGLALFLGVGCTGSKETGPTPPPAGIGPLIERAERAEGHGDLDGAVDAYRQAFEQTPWNTRVRSALAATLSRRGAQKRDRGSLPGAESDLRAARELEPDDAEIAHNLAVVLVERAALDLDASVAAVRRTEAAELSPRLVATTKTRDALVERRLDLAHDLIERGQVDAGVVRLEALHSEHPEHAHATRLLALALVRQGNGLHERRNYDGAADAFGRAVELYGGCDAATCERGDVELAHRNRVVALLEAGRTHDARGALANAGEHGFAFPDLAAALAERFE